MVGSEQKTSAACARQPHSDCAQTASKIVSSPNASLQAEPIFSHSAIGLARVRLLSDVDLLFLVHMTQEIDEATDKSDGR